MQQFINLGASVNEIDSEKQTPLHFARSKEVAQLLVNANADLNALDDQNRTPSEISFLKGDLDLMMLLIDKSADWKVLQKSHPQFKSVDDIRNFFVDVEQQ